MLRRVAILGVLVTAAPAEAGWMIEQKVVYPGAGDAAFSWRVGERGFRVDVKRAGETRHFVFNGQTFYLCGRLDKSRIAYVKSLRADPAVLDSLAKGACQELATDFAVRFFMSPYDAVGNVEVAQGFAAGVRIDEASVALGGSVGNVQKTKCVDLSRTWTVKDAQAPKLSVEVEEESCRAAAVHWRTALSRELGKAVLRRVGGKSTYKSLTADLKKAPGLALTAKAEITGTDGAGKKLSRGYSVSTSAAKETEPSDADLATPAGFKFIDVDNLEPMKPAKSVAAKGKGEDEGEELADVVVRMMLGVVPGAGVIKAALKDGDD